MPARGSISANPFEQCASDVDRCAAGDFRAGAGGDDLPHSSEAVELANNTVYGLAACVWSESINVALHVAAQMKAGVVWVNCTNLFDASCGFGGYRESGYGREGGREGLLEYMEPAWFKNAPALPAQKIQRAGAGIATMTLPLPALNPAPESIAR